MSNRARQQRVETKLEQEANALMRAKPQLTKAQAVTAIIEADPSWVDDFDRAARADIRAQATEQLAENRGE